MDVFDVNSFHLSKRRRKRIKKLHLLVLYLARLLPRLDLISIPLQLLDLLLEIPFELLLEVRIVRIINLSKPKAIDQRNQKNRRKKKSNFQQRSDLVPNGVELLHAFMDLLEDPIDLRLKLPTRSHGDQAFGGLGFQRILGSRASRVFQSIKFFYFYFFSRVGVGEGETFDFWEK